MTKKHIFLISRYDIIVVSVDIETDEDGHVRVT
jgi:hypothetical protein